MTARNFNNTSSVNLPQRHGEAKHEQFGKA